MRDLFLFLPLRPDRNQETSKYRGLDRYPGILAQGRRRGIDKKGCGRYEARRLGGPVGVAAGGFLEAEGSPVPNAQ